MVPGIGLRCLRASTFIEVPLGRRAGLYAEGPYLQVLSVGELASDAYFGPMWGLGVEGNLGARVEIGAGLELRAAAQLTRYLSLFGKATIDGTVGAADQYLGATLQIRYSLL